MSITNKTILLATVPHTGTRFFLNIIEGLMSVKHHIMRQDTERRPLREHVLATCHLGPKNWNLICEYIDLFDPVLITLDRDHKRVVTSYEKRGKNDGRLAESYFTSDAFRLKYDPLILSVDSEDRAERLSLLSGLLGKPIDTDWLPVGSYDDKMSLK